MCAVVDVDESVTSDDQLACLYTLISAEVSPKVKRR